MSTGNKKKSLIVIETSHVFCFCIFLYTKTPNKSWNYVSYRPHSGGIFQLWAIPVTDSNLNPEWKWKNRKWKLASKNVPVTRTCSWYFIMGYYIMGSWYFMGYWPVVLKGEEYNCFSIIQLVGQKLDNKVSKCKEYLFGNKTKEKLVNFATRWLLLLDDYY